MAMFRMRSGEMTGELSSGMICGNDHAKCQNASGETAPSVHDPTGLQGRLNPVECVICGAVRAQTYLDKPFAEALRNWLTADKRYLIGVSGGRDSMALLHFLREAGYTDLVVCHVNHGLRGSDSDGDETFVKNGARDRGFAFESVSANVKEYAESEHLSIETAARELRYRAFSDIAGKLKCGRVFLGHHADDQVETVLINLFRGTGGRGIAGMRRESTRGGLTLLRPFLEIPRTEVDRYVSENEIAYREDVTNGEEFALRNRVRNTLIPTINEVFERDVRDAVLRAAKLAERDEAWATAVRSELPIVDGGLAVDQLRELPIAHRNRLLLLWLRDCGVPKCGEAEVERVVAVLLSDGKPAKTNLPGDIHARRRAGLLFLEFPDDSE